MKKHTFNIRLAWGAVAVAAAAAAVVFSPGRVEAFLPHEAEAYK